MPKPKHAHPHGQDRVDKRVVGVAKDFAVAALNARAFDKFDKPEELAAYCLKVSKDIIDYDSDIDVDEDT